MYADYDVDIDIDAPGMEEIAASWIWEKAQSYKSKFKKLAETENFADLWIEWYLDDLDDAIKFMGEAEIERDEIVCYAWEYMGKYKYYDELLEVMEEKKEEIHDWLNDELTENEDPGLPRSWAY